MASERGKPTRLHGGFSLHGEEARGFACDLDDLDARFVVEILADGLPVGLVRATLYVDELRIEGLGDGRYGFAAVLPASVLVGDIVLEARLANCGHAIGAPIVADRRPPVPSAKPVGVVTWSGGLRLTGSLADPKRLGTEVKAIVDGQVVARCVAAAWTQRDGGPGRGVVPRFDLHCPPWMADGRVRHVDVVAGDGTALVGTPCFVVAFADGLESAIDRLAGIESETLRARHLERLIPQSLPFTAFADWSERFASPTPQRLAPAEVGVVLVGLEGVAQSVASLEAQVGTACVVACVPALNTRVEFDPRDLLTFLETDAAEIDRLVFGLSGTRFEPTAIAGLAGALAAFPQARSAYCDLSEVGGDGRVWPLALTAFDQERCLEQGYCAYVFAMRRDVVLAALRRGAASLFRLFNAQLDDDPEGLAEPVHLPQVLARPPALPADTVAPALRRAAEAHLEAKGVIGQVERRPAAFGAAVRVRRAPAARSLVSIIVATRNRPQALRRLVESLEAHANRTPFELIVADGDSSDPAALDLLENLSRSGARTLRVPGPFNRARVSSRGATLARGDLLLFVDDGLAAREAGWLDGLTERMAAADVGAVGALMAWPSNIVESAGLVLGPGFAAAPAFGDRVVGEAGHAGLLEVAHEVSALPASCLMTRQALFAAQQGFDARCFSLRHADVDYCLHLRAQGFRLIVTPDVRIAWQRPPSGGNGLRADLQDRAARETAILRARWGDILLADPYYSPWLALDGLPFSALAWPPRDRVARQRHHGPARPIPSGL